MALEVSRQVKSDVKSELITRDFLGGCSNKIDTKELDLDLHVPSGWEKRLDLESGKVYIQRCNPATQGNDQRSIANKLSSQLQHFNAFHQSSKMNTTVNLLEQPNCSPSSYTSVCTLDKVKSALEKAERSSPSSSLSSRKRWKCSPSPSNSSSLSIKESEDEEASPSGLSGLLVAAACPRCFLYVLISKNDPKCPKCASVVQVPEMMTKKPKFDLNL